MLQAAALALACGRARAADWPSRPIHVIVPFPPGGTTDVVTRLVAAEMGPLLGQSVVVDNKPGAGTVIGVDAAAKSPADGHTLVTVANSFCINATLLKKLPYDGAHDLRPVALLGMSEHVLAVYPGSGLKTLADLKAAALKDPGRLTYASFGIGTSAHLAGAMLAEKLGVQLTHVPYKGQAPALNDLLGGQVTMMFGNWPELRAQVRAGKLVALGMATAKRSVYAPDLPTLAEQGVALESNSWSGLLTRAAVPEAVVARLNEAAVQALHAASVEKAFHEGGIADLAGSPSAFAEFIRSETAKYAAVIHQAGLSVDTPS